MGKVVQSAIRDEHTLSQTTLCWNSACLMDTQRRDYLYWESSYQSQWIRGGYCGWRLPFGNVCIMLISLYFDAFCFQYFPHWKIIFPFRGIRCFVHNIFMIHTIVRRVLDDLNINIFCWSKGIISSGCWTTNENFNHGWKGKGKLEFTLIEYF